MQFQISDFKISASILEKYKDIIDLILWSSTIETKEQKQYWIDSLSVMNDDQVANLRNILTEEKNELKKIDDDYNSKVKQAQSQAKQSISEEELAAKRKAILIAEKQDRDSEKQKEDDLLKQIENL